MTTAERLVRHCNVGATAEALAFASSLADHGLHHKSANNCDRQQHKQATECSGFEEGGETIPFSGE